MLFYVASAAFLAAAFLWSRKIAVVWRLLLTVVIVAIFSFIVLVDEVVTRGGLPWYESAPYKHLIALVMMLLGMVAKYTYDLIEQRKASGSKAAISWDWWDFAQPFTVAVISFGAFWQLHGQEELTMNWLVVSFQNGFFWRTILTRTQQQAATV